MGMKLCMVPAFALGAYKQIIELKKHGHTVIGISDRTTPFYAEYDRFNLYCRAPSFMRVSKELKYMNVDLVVVHHEPGWMAVVAKEAGHKVVVDVGDLDMARTGKVTLEEVKILECADGLIFNSEAVRDVVLKNKIKITGNEQVIYHCANSKFFADPKTTKGGVVCQGTIVSPFSSSKITSYRNMFPVADAFVEIKIKFHMIISSFCKKYAHDYIKRYHTSPIPLNYCCAPETLNDQYVFIYNSLPYEELVRKMGDYHWGFVGTPVKNSYMDYVVPHRMFDYMAAGIPIMVMNMKKTSEFVEREGIGVTINEYSDIKKYYDLWEEKQKVVLEVRNKWAMENHINKVTQVFEEAIKGGKNG
jgi:hypothetical protein